MYGVTPKMGLSMDEALELENYLPVEFRDVSQSNYIDILWKSFKNSYSGGDYQFSFVACHMLMMSFLYFGLWKIKIARPKDFEHSLIGFGKKFEKSIKKATSPFVFHEIKERAVFRLLKVIGCDNDKIGKYARLVDERNKAVHSNGVTSFDTQSAINNQITETIRVTKEIQETLKPVIKELYVSFLEDSTDPETREYLDDSDQVKEVLIRNNYFSRADISCCQDYDLSSLSDHKKVNATTSLHEELSNFMGLVSL